jgi:protein SCO1/2
MNKTSIISFFILIVFLGIGSSWVINKANESNSIPPPVMKKIPDFNLINYDGKPFSRDSLLNKISVIDFIFTSCPGPCPIMSKNMRELYNQYKLHPDLQFISISVDPDYDNLEVLNAYADANGVTDKRWKFLRGKMIDIKNLSTNGFLFMSENLPAGHSVKFVLSDSNANIRQYYDGTDKASISILRKHLNIFLKNMNLKS